MDTMKLLTIVIPSYNAEKFLDIGIPTFIDERINREIEVIIVDDGSTDKTPQIADGYMKKYPSVIKVVHKKNGGHGSAINCGIANATGKYFCIVDADDWCDTEKLVKLVENMKGQDADLILTHSSKVDVDGEVFGYEKVRFRGVRKRNLFAK